MRLGIVMLVHDAFDRGIQLARHWATNGCPVVVHVDERVSLSDYDAFVSAFTDLPDVRFCDRRPCDWGTWSLVSASQAASEMLLAAFPDVTHTMLVSGSCLPLRPIPDLLDYLERHPGADFIESVTTQDVPWTTGGLDIERFTLRFPFSWKRHRRLFDRYVSLQRRVGFKRKIPNGLTPHLGSQWWCLTRDTLWAILSDPNRPIYDNYFKRVWIPDESYYQTLARLHSGRIESRSLTLSKFDFQGKPHVFYDDHLQLLRRSNCFVARKAWHHADKLYESFLSLPQEAPNDIEPNPGPIDQIFARAIERRTMGRPGLIMQSRVPRVGLEHSKTASRYAVLSGFSELFEGFEDWLSQVVNARVHGNLFAKDKAHFADNAQVFFGAQCNSAPLRDYNAEAFLTSLIWNTRGERQCFQFGPHDSQDITWSIAKDANARTYVISGAWMVPLFLSGKDVCDIRSEAARLQKRESDYIRVLRSPYTRARVHIWSLADFVSAPEQLVQLVVDDIGAQHVSGSLDLPQMKPLDGLGQFLQQLKNQGMQPYLVGDFAAGSNSHNARDQRQKPRLVRS